MKETWAVIAIEKRQPHAEPFNQLSVIGPGIRNQAGIFYETVSCSEVLFRGKSREAAQEFIELFQQPHEFITYTKLIETRLWEEEEA